MILAGGGPWNIDGGSTVTLDTTGGRSGSKAMKIARATGTAGDEAARGGFGTVTHFFAEYYFKLVTTGQRSEVKWLIIHHDAEGNSACSGTIARYQFGFTTDTGIFQSVPKPRFKPRGEGDGVTVCDGPYNGGSQTGFFTWSGDAQEPAPVMDTDPDIGDTEWGALNDGNFHKYTIELKTGTGTASYLRLWIDGFKFWDSFGSPMSFPGLPTSWLFEMVSGGTTDAFDVWFDDITLWKR